MAESKITVARVKDKVGGREAEVSKLLYSDNGNIKTIGGDSAITANSAKTLNGETKEQLLKNVDAATVGGKSLHQLQSRGMFGPVKMLMNEDSLASPLNYHMVVTDDEEILYCGYNHVACLVMNKVGNVGLPWIPLPNPLKGISRIKQVIGQNLTQFLLYENGDLYARGNNEGYTLGVGNTANQFNWVKVTDNVSKLCLAQPGYQGNRSSYAVIKRDGSVWFWGENAYGQAGQGNTTTLQVPTKLSLTFLEAGDTVKDVILSDTYYTSSYIITNKGKVYSCGLNDNGQLGLNDKTNRTTFTQVTTLQDKKVVELSTSCSYNYGSSQYYYITVIAKCSDNSYYAWGTSGQFKISKTSTNSNIPLLLDDSYFPTGYRQAQDPFIDLYVASHNTFTAVTRSGRLFVCGYNSYGHMGVGHTNDVATFTEVKIPNESNAKIRKVWVSRTCQYAYINQVILLVEINSKKYLYAAGRNNYGSTGTNLADDNVTTFNRVVFPPDKVENIKTLRIEGYSEYSGLRILLNNGQYWACGYNAYCQITGNGSAVTPINYPILVL